MDFTNILALVVIAAAVWAVLRGVDVRLALFTAALVLGMIALDPAPIIREFLATFSNEKFVMPICTAMGFAYVLKHTGCDRHLVRVLVEPVRRVRVLMVPGVVGVGFLVNIPVISQTSTAVCLGTVVVPVMRAAGFSALTTGAALLLGASVGGELLNPGAPELLTVQAKTGKDTREMIPNLLPLVLVQLAVSGVVLWGLEWWRSRSSVGRVDSSRPDSVPAAMSGLEDSPRPTRLDDEPLNPLKAMIPLVPLALLFLTGPPLNKFTGLHIPPEWVVLPASPPTGKPDPYYSTRLIGLAMMVGVGAAAAVAPRKIMGCMKAFFEGAGYGFANIISLIVIANCFGKAIEHVGLAKPLGALIAGDPVLLQPLAGAVPAAFGFVCGSGMASTQSLYGFFHDPAVALGQDPIDVGAMVALGSAAGRTMSPVSAVMLMTAALTGTDPFALMKRVAPPLIVGLIVVIVLRVAGVV